MSNELIDEQELTRRFPRSRQYNWEWIAEGSMGSHVLWMTEWLCERLDLRPGMRVLDLGCGKVQEMNHPVPRRGQAHFAPKTPQNEPVPGGFVRVP